MGMEDLIAEIAMSLCFRAFRTTANKSFDHAYPAARKLQLRPMFHEVGQSRQRKSQRRSSDRGRRGRVTVAEKGRHRNDVAIEYGSGVPLVSDDRRGQRCLQPKFDCDKSNAMLGPCSPLSA
jgi:hypothetical protein